MSTEHNKTNQQSQSVQPTDKVNRIEVIDHSDTNKAKDNRARAYQKHNAKSVEIQLQDDGKTLKICVK